MVGMPTDLQSRAWKEISGGGHVLVTAPTGSGKTLAAFLWGLDCLASGKWPGKGVRMLYVSPMKALNNDVERNLILPLSQLEAHFARHETPFPEIRVRTRSGDTPADVRRKMGRYPPEILITTPESLNILLTSDGGRRMLTGIRTVILDELHAVMGEKRGVHLITAVDRLVLLSGEFQRIALSATCNPVKTATDFVGGFEIKGNEYRPRQVVHIDSDMEKSCEIRVCFPDGIQKDPVTGSIWPGLIREFRSVVGKNRSTLFFADSRRLAEKVTRLLNEGADTDIAWAHHGSLSKEIRLAVEARLKEGKLPAIVATNSLELGIDIGDLDQVVLIRTPKSAVSAIQRLGRAGHGIGEVSRGLLFPTHGRDLVDAAVMARCIAEKQMEEVRPPECPMDVLAQVILSMCSSETWDMEDLYRFLKSSRPYARLSFSGYEGLLEMLAGRYSESRIRELSPRLSIDRVDRTVQARQGAKMILYMAGGTIPDRGYFNLRHQKSGSRIGELDEEFVWERRVGESFAFGTQTWRIRRITHNDVEVTPETSHPGIIPFWRGEALNRSFFLSDRIGRFLEEADARLSDPDFETELVRRHFMEPSAAKEMIDFLIRQKKASRAELPHRHHVLIEHFQDPENRSDAKQVILHTLWGGRINHPFAAALSAFIQDRFGYSIRIFPDDDAVSILLPHGIEGGFILEALTPDNVESWLEKGLASTGFFGARFRENAGRALLLPRTGFRKRMPLWVNRLRSKKLLSAVSRFPDFPILLETWRTCLEDSFDMDNLRMLLGELETGAVRFSETVTREASPFAGNLIWRQTNHFMYTDDTPEGKNADGISDRLLEQIHFSSALRPRIPDRVIRDLTAKLQATAPGYSPGNSVDLIDWVKERLFIPEDQWAELLSAVFRDHGISEENITEPVKSKILTISGPGIKVPLVCALENKAALSSAFRLPESAFSGFTCGLFDTVKKSAEERLSGFAVQILSYYGPVSVDFFRDLTGLEEDESTRLIRRLEEEGLIVLDRFREENETLEICHAQNLEILLRMTRKARQTGFPTLDLSFLPLFMARFQNVARKKPAEKMEDLQESLDLLFGFPAPAGAWEKYILPARMDLYHGAWLDNLFQTTDLCWFGCGPQKLSFAFRTDLELFLENSDDENSGADLDRLFPDPGARYPFFDLHHDSGTDTGSFTKILWNAAWEGKIANDGFAVVRSGILNRFSAGKDEPLKRGRRSGFNRWKSERPIPGNWYRIPRPAAKKDILEEVELIKDRIRQLLRRYGILFRELVNRELPVMGWRGIFKLLRLMELSGEIVSGRFFEGISGAQFLSADAAKSMAAPLDQETIFWINAMDPASVCGLFPGAPLDLPPRRETTWLVYEGTRAVMTIMADGKRVEIRVPPDHQRLPLFFKVFRVIVGREFSPSRFVRVETVNGESAAQSPYASAFFESGFETDGSGLELRRRV